MSTDDARRVSRWRCSWHACPAIAFGVGSSTMLRALGWYVRPGPSGTRLCPEHRLDGGIATAERVTDDLYDALQELQEETPASQHKKQRPAVAATTQEKP